jgi:6-phosphogluconate dehydrogenase (decarboxylating)
MEEGDVLVDGGNEWYPNTIRRAEELKVNAIVNTLHACSLHTYPYTIYMSSIV